MKLMGVVSTSLSNVVTKGFLLRHSSSLNAMAVVISPDVNIDPDKVGRAVQVHVI